MAANLGTAWIQVKPSMNGVRGNILSNLKGTGTAASTQMGNEVAKSKGMTTGMAVAWGAATAVGLKAITAISNKIKSSIDSAIKRVDTLNNANRTFENMGIKGATAAREVKTLTKNILGLPTPLDSAIRGMTALTATYGDISLGRKVFKALNDSILGFGGTAEMVDNAITQLSQLPMDGPLDAQTWNSLRNSGITPVLVAMAKDSGMSVSAMKKAFGDGELKVEDFINKLIKLDEKGGGGLKSLEKIAQDSTKGIGTAIANANTAISRGVAKIIEALGSEGIANAISGSGARIESVLGSVAKVIQYVAKNADIASAAVIGLSTAFLVSLVPSIMKAIGPLNLIGTRIGLLGLKLGAFAKVAFIPALIGAIVGAIALFVMQSGGVDQAGQKIAEVFSSIGETVKGFIDMLPAVIDGIANFFTTQFPQIFDSLVKTVIAAAPKVLAGFMSLVDGIGTTLVKNGPTLVSTFISVLENLVQSVTSNIGKFAKIGTDIIVKLLDSITAALPSLITAGVQILNQLIDAIVAALPKVIQAGLEIINKLVDAITTNLPKLIASAVLIITALVSGLIAVLPSLIDAALQIILALANALLDNLPTIINAAVTLLTTLVTALLDNLPMIIDAAVKLIVALVNGLIGALPQLLSAAVTLIGRLAGALVGLVPVIIGAGITLIVALVGALIQSIPKLIGAAGRLIGSLVVAIVRLVPTLVSSGFKLITGLVSGLLGSIGKVISGAGKIGGKIIDTLSKINLLNVGKDLIRGLWDGISNMAGWIGEKIKGFGDGVMKGLKDFFGIKSPSRVMRDQIGEMLGLGIASGITRSTKAAVSAAVRQSQAVVSAYGDMSAQAGGINADGTMSMAGGYASGNIFNITNPSPEQTAAIVASRMKGGM